MPIVTDNYKLSLTQDDRVIRIRCSQNDTSRQVKFTIYNNGMPFTIPSGLSVSVRGIKQNGNIFSKSCSYSGSVVTLNLDSQITNVAGISVAELVFTDSGGGKIGTSNFIFQVEYDPLLRGTIDVTEETPTEYISDLISMVEALSARVNNIVAPEGEASLSEVVDARLSGYSGITYQSLKARIDADFALIEIPDIDDTLSNVGDAAEASRTGFEFASVKKRIENISPLVAFSWTPTLGSINTSTGGANTSSTRVRSAGANLPVMKHGDYLECNYGKYQIRVFAYNGTLSTNNFIGEITSDWTSGIVAIPDAYIGKQIAWMVRDKDDANLTNLVNTFSDIVFYLNSGSDTELDELSSNVVQNKAIAVPINKLMNSRSKYSDWIVGKAINLSVGIGNVVNLNPTTNENVRYQVIDCSGGDVFTISGVGSDTQRLFGFVNDNNELLSVASMDTKYSYHIVVAPEDADKLIVQNLVEYIPIVGDIPVYSGVHDDFNCGQRKIAEENVSWVQRSLTTSGYSVNAKNLTTTYWIGINRGQTLKIENKSKNHNIAVYSIKDNVIRLASVGGYKNGYSRLEFKDYTCAYMIRMQNSGNTTIPVTDGQYVDVKIINECLYDVPTAYPARGNIKNVCYERNYALLNNNINCVVSDLNENGQLVESTTRCVITLPKHGLVEVKSRLPGGMFKVVKVSGNSATWLVEEWSYYTYRYIGDGTSEYLCLVGWAPEGTATMTVDKALDAISVYSIFDVGRVIERHKHILNGKKVAFIGDSITQGRFAKFAGSVNATAVKPFGELIAEYVNDYNYGNFGIGGAYVSNGGGLTWKSLLTNCDKVSGYDVVFVLGGTNDYGGNISSSDFTSDFISVVTELMNNNSEVVVCTPLFRTSKTGKNTADLYLYDYAGIIKSSAESKEIKCIDLYSITNNGLFVDYLPDGLHPDEAGHKILADVILQEYEDLENAGT